MAKRSKSAAYQNPVAKPDPRFDPANDAESAKAHDLPPRKIPEAIERTDDEADAVQQTVRKLLDEAIDYYEEELEPDQIKATEYYKGEPFGDEKEGRSKVVNTVVRDATLGQMSPLIGMIYEGDRPVEFTPGDRQDAPQADQATDYIRHIVSEDNPGFKIHWDWFLDGLVRRLGVVKYWWDEVPRKTLTNYTGLTEQELQALAADEDVEIESGTARPGPDGSLFYDVTAFHVERTGRVRIMGVPNEEIVFTPDSASFESARLVAHVREMPADELVALLIADGMDPDEADELVDEHKGQSRDKSSDSMNAARQFDGMSRKEMMNNADDLEDVCLYSEAYVRMKLKNVEGDYEDDLAPELRLFKCIGASHEIINGDGYGECVDDHPFADWTPIPEAHTIIGLSNWDLLKDIQRIISQIERGTLDSLAQAITPVTEVVSGMVNMQDFINPEIAGIRRVRAIGQTNNIVHHFVGGDTLPVLGYYNDVITDRTGKTRGVGIEAESLQSTTQVAASEYVSAAKERVELIARVFCETGLRKLYKGLLKLITKHHQYARVVRLRNTYVEVDPRHWDTTMDVRVNMPIGAGTKTERIATLAEIAGKQQELLQTGSPLVSNIELRHTYGEMLEMMGKKNTDKFFKPWGEQEEAQLQQQMASQPPPPDANMALVEVERQKAAAEMAMDMQKFELEKWKAEQDVELQKQKMAQDATLKEIEIEKKYNAEINDTEVQAKIALEKAAMDNETKRQAVGAMKEPRTVRLERGA